MRDRASSSARARKLGEEEPLPPDDRLAGEQWRAELEMLYRASAAPLVDQLSRSGSKDGLDIVHEAFARLLGLSRAKTLSITQPHAYVARISRNLQSDLGRFQNVRRAWCDEVTATGEQHHDPVVHLETRDTLRRLEAAIAKLKPLTRDIFLARRVDGLSYSEIAELTGLSAKGIEKHMAKAIAKLSRLMNRR
jgi:RNA polymerase sigma-70 factor (ECF subfamily)